MHEELENWLYDLINHAGNQLAELRSVIVKALGVREQIRLIFERLA